jgi:predicted small lipoprotein YifL
MRRLALLLLVALASCGADGPPARPGGGAFSLNPPL